MTGIRRGGGSLLLQVELGLEAGHQLVHLVLAVEGEHQVGHELLVEVILALRIGEYVDSRHTDIIDHRLDLVVAVARVVVMNVSTMGDTAALLTSIILALLHELSSSSTVAVEIERVREPKDVLAADTADVSPADTQMYRLQTQ